MTKLSEEMIALIASKTVRDESTGCDIWTGVLTHGYATISYQGKKALSRLLWEHVHGPIPNGLCVCHTCDTPACINISHFFLGTHKENMQDRQRKGRNSGARKPISVERIRQIEELIASGARYDLICNTLKISSATLWRVKYKRYAACKKENW